MAASRSTKIKTANYFCDTTPSTSVKIKSRKNFQPYGAIILNIDGSHEDYISRIREALNPRYSAMEVNRKCAGFIGDGSINYTRSPMKCQRLRCFNRGQNSRLFYDPVGLLFTHTLRT